MEEILACRVCLATDIKLYDIYKYGLVNALESISGTEVSTSDSLLHHLCSFCSAMLLKCITFQKRCQISQDLLNYALLNDVLVTTDYIRNLDRETHKLILPYSFIHHSIIACDGVIIKNEVDTSGKGCENNDEIITNFEDNDNKIGVSFDNSDSDEEPLSKKLSKVNKKLKRKRKTEEKVIKIEIKEENDIETDVKNVEFENIDEHFDIDDLEDDTEVDCIQTCDGIEVITLTKQQQIEEVQARKNSHNYMDSYLKCDKCFKGFVTEVTYKNHMAKHDPAFGKYVCEICETRWACVRSLRAHVVTSHEKKYICKQCGHVAKSSNKAREHSRWHSGFVYVCDVCGASFRKSTSHLTHIRLHHPTGHTCELCGESFIGQYGLNMHKKKAHRSVEDKVKCESQCSTCGIRFRSVTALETHRNNSGLNICDNTNKPCVFCGIGYKNDEILRDHLKEQHQDEHSVKCLQCNKKFVNSRTYAIHYQHFHLGDTSLRLKRRREGYRNTVQNVVCEICGKKCRSKATLIYHQRIHTGEKPYQCTECPKTFSILQRLQIHLRTHTGERPFKCSHCPKAFKQKAALNRHDRVHTGVKPYSCSYCGKSFSQSNSMKTHIHTVHLKLPAPYRNSKRNKLE